MKLFDVTLQVLERALDARLMRQNVLSGNLANANTPGFQPRDVSFQVALTSVFHQDSGDPDAKGEFAVEGGEGTGLRSLVAHTKTEIINAQGSARQDGNRVDVERTQVEMAENGIQYNASARATSKKLGILRYVAGDGA